MTAFIFSEPTKANEVRHEGTKMAAADYWWRPWWRWRSADGGRRARGFGELGGDVVMNTDTETRTPNPAVPICALCGGTFCGCGDKHCELQMARLPADQNLYHLECAFFLQAAIKVIWVNGGHVAPVPGH